MRSVDTLIELFTKFPGIGPRQAKRFVYFLLGKNGTFTKELITALSSLSKQMRVCPSCYRFFYRENTESSECNICLDTHREKSYLLVVGGNIDLENIEKSGYWHGYYFVLGGNIPILEKNPEQRVRLRELKAKVEKEGKTGTLKEIVLALSTTPDGEHTASYVKGALEPIAAQYGIKISMLGRGLSTGAEIEYSDSETIKNALQNRH